jgi:hypothetical protein
MRSSAPSSKSLLVAASMAMASLGLSACGPDYAIFKVHVTSANPRNDINSCTMTITNEADKDVLKDWVLKKEYSNDGAGNITLKQGCEGGLTKADVGYFSYSSSRSSGSLLFWVKALGDNGELIQTKSARAEVKAFPPEIGVDVAMARCDGSPKPEECNW